MVGSFRAGERGGVWRTPLQARPQSRAKPASNQSGSLAADLLQGQPKPLGKLRALGSARLGKFPQFLSCSFIQQMFTEPGPVPAAWH